MDYLVTTNRSNSSNCFQFDNNVGAVVGVKIGISAIGVLTCLLAIAIILVDQRYRKNFVYRLVGYLIFASLLESLAYIFEQIPLESSNNRVVLRNGSAFEGLCTFAGFFVEYSTLVEDFIVVWIVFYLLWAVCEAKPKCLGPRCREICGVFGSFIAAALVSWIPFVNNMYGFGGLSCWIKLTTDGCHDATLGFVYQFTLYYVPMLILVVVSLVIFISLCTLVLYKGIRHGEGCCHQPLTPMFPLFLYAVVYDLTCILVTANRIYFAVQIPSGIKPIYDLWLFVAIADSVRALLPSAVFILHWIIGLNCKRVERSGYQQMQGTDALKENCSNMA